MPKTLSDAIQDRRAARSQDEYPTFTAVDFFESAVDVQSEMLKGCYLTCEDRHAADVAATCIREEHGAYVSRRFVPQYIDGPGAGFWRLFVLPAETCQAA